MAFPAMLGAALAKGGAAKGLAGAATSAAGRGFIGRGMAMAGRLGGRLKGNWKGATSMLTSTGLPIGYDALTGSLGEGAQKAASWGQRHPFLAGAAGTLGAHAAYTGIEGMLANRAEHGGGGPITSENIGMLHQAHAEMLQNNLHALQAQEGDYNLMPEDQRKQLAEKMMADYQRLWGALYDEGSGTYELDMDEQTAAALGKLRAGLAGGQPGAA